MKDSATNKYLMLCSERLYESEFYSVLGVDLRPNTPLSQQLAKYLYGIGLSIISYTELLSRTSLQYSFVNQEAGTEYNYRSLYVEVDIVNIDKLKSDDTSVKFVTLTELIESLSKSPYTSELDRLSLAVLRAKEQLFDT